MKASFCLYVFHYVPDSHQVSINPTFMCCLLCSQTVIKQKVLSDGGQQGPLISDCHDKTKPHHQSAPSVLTSPLCVIRGHRACAKDKRCKLQEVVISVGKHAQSIISFMDDWAEGSQFYYYFFSPIVWFSYSWLHLMFYKARKQICDLTEYCKNK